MSSKDENVRIKWARFRFSIIGPLWAAPPERGQLQKEIEHLSQKSYEHPVTGQKIRFGASTIERWFYLAHNHPDDPFLALARKVPKHVGTHRSFPVLLQQKLREQYRQHPNWSYQLHYDNLMVVAQQNPEMGQMPSYPTVVRFMKGQRLLKYKRRKRKRRDEANQKETGDFSQREMRSFEVEYVGQLWHADFHEGSRCVLQPNGTWVRPVLFGCLDDRCRQCGHLQWYLEQTAETFVHGLCQAILKRGLPRALLTDNGKPMLAAECTEGLERLGIVHHTTLLYTPEQNAKQESFWGQVEGRLVAMLEGVKELTLPLLNEATQAWVELEYHQKPHSEIGDSPLSVALNTKSQLRKAPDADYLRRMFRTERWRTQRRSDGTITVHGVRFELPNRYRTLLRVAIRVARWDLSTIDLIDPRTQKVLCALYPLDKRQNADRKRRVIKPISDELEPEPTSSVAPLLDKLMADYAATGLVPAYLPHRKKNRLRQKDPDTEPDTQTNTYTEEPINDPNNDS